MAEQSSAAPTASADPVAVPDDLPPPHPDNETEHVMKNEVPWDEPWEVRRQSIPLRVDVEWLDFEHFKNRYSEEEGLAIIEVLCGHSQIAQEVSKETMQRARGLKDLRVPPPKTKITVDGESYWMQRVRIQSPLLILLLSRLTGHHDKWPIYRPRTFFPPFRAFYYHLPQLKRCLELLEKKVAPDTSTLPKETATDSFQKLDQEPVNDDIGVKSSSKSDSGDDTTENEDPKAMMTPEIAIVGEIIDSSPIALDHLRELVNFTESYVVPNWHRASGTSKHKFRFTDLWMAFKPGELLYAPVRSDSSNTLDSAPDSRPKMYQTAWRLLSLDVDFISDEKPDDTLKSSNRQFHLLGYYMDYDGNSYVPVSHIFSIKCYEGEKEITSLDIYPMRFAKDAEKIKMKLYEQGCSFRKAITKKCLSYDGWTLIHEPTGKTPESTIRPSARHIDSDVIIDFVEGYQSEPMLGTGPSSWQKGLTNFDDSNEWPVGEDNLPIIHWKPKPNSNRLERFAEIGEKTQRAEWFGERLQREALSTRQSLNAYQEGRSIKEIDEDELLLLPCRVVAYAFRERQFFFLHTDHLTDFLVTRSLFRDLKIDENHKLLVKSLVKTHLEKQAAQKLHPNVSLNQDIIRGKGSGLVILLHGVPGVGKTATAEAVAQTNGKPLFVITCGDLGFTPKEVEESLKEIFRLAQLWDCILLLDEADIFLSRRELGDLKRNALVSVFLRVLEYYGGILFLTTNRVGTLDEAFKSRIHISLYYPPLNEKQTLQIFDVNIQKLQRILKDKHELQLEQESDVPKRPIITVSGESILDWARWHYRTRKYTPEQRWNGRQIRNAFQIAHSLAEFEVRSAELAQFDEADEEDQPENYAEQYGTGPGANNGQLDWEQFDRVAQALEKFEDYLYVATNGTDEDRARKEFIRADSYDIHATPEKPVYRPPFYQQPSSRSYPGQRMAPRTPHDYRQFKEGISNTRPLSASRNEQPTPLRESYSPNQQPQSTLAPPNVSAGPPMRNPISTMPVRGGRGAPSYPVPSGHQQQHPPRSSDSNKPLSGVPRRGYPGSNSTTPRTSQYWQNRERESGVRDDDDDGLFAREGAHYDNHHGNYYANSEYERDYNGQGHDEQDDDGQAYDQQRYEQGYGGRGEDTDESFRGPGSDARRNDG